MSTSATFNEAERATPSGAGIIDSRGIAQESQFDYVRRRLFKARLGVRSFERLPWIHDGHIRVGAWSIGTCCSITYSKIEDPNRTVRSLPDHIARPTWIIISGAPVVASANARSLSVQAGHLGVVFGPHLQLAVARRASTLVVGVDGAHIGVRRVQTERAGWTGRPASWQADLLTRAGPVVESMGRDKRNVPTDATVDRYISAMAGLILHPILRGLSERETVAAERRRYETAIAFIRSNLHLSGLDAEAIAQHLGVSTRQLFRTFEGGPGIGKLITEERIAAARTLLAAPSSSTGSIARVAES